MLYVVATVWRKQEEAADTIVLQMHRMVADNTAQAVERATALGQMDIDDSHGPGFTKEIHKIATITTS